MRTKNAVEIGRKNTEEEEARRHINTIIGGAVESLSCLCGYSRIDRNHFEARRFAADEHHLRKVKNYKENGTERRGDKTKRLQRLVTIQILDSFHMSNVAVHRTICSIVRE